MLHSILVKNNASQRSGMWEFQLFQPWEGCWMKISRRKIEYRSVLGDAITSKNQMHHVKEFWVFSSFVLQTSFCRPLMSSKFKKRFSFNIHSLYLICCIFLLFPESVSMTTLQAFSVEAYIWRSRRSHLKYFCLVF